MKALGKPSGTGVLHPRGKIVEALNVRRKDLNGWNPRGAKIKNVRSGSRDGLSGIGRFSQTGVEIAPLIAPGRLIAFVKRNVLELRTAVQRRAGKRFALMEIGAVNESLVNAQSSRAIKIHAPGGRPKKRWATGSGLGIPIGFAWNGTVPASRPGRRAAFDVSRLFEETIRGIDRVRTSVSGISTTGATMRFGIENGIITITTADDSPSGGISGTGPRSIVTPRITIIPGGIFDSAVR